MAINKDQALLFIQEVQTRLRPSSNEYKTFVAMMQKYMSRTLQTNEVVQNASVIFGDFPALERQFTSLLTSRDDEARPIIEIDGEARSIVDVGDDDDSPKHEPKRSAAVLVAPRGAKKAKTGVAAKKSPDTASDEALARELQAEFDGGNSAVSVKPGGKKRRGNGVAKERVAADGSGCSYVPERDHMNQYVADSAAAPDTPKQSLFKLNFQVRKNMSKSPIPDSVFGDRQSLLSASETKGQRLGLKSKDEAGIHSC
jgi:histone deacetylase complex regulatory component SIN3